MKKMTFILGLTATLLLLDHSKILAQADIHIRKRVQTDAVYDIGTVFPAETTEREVWLGNKQMAYITRSMVVIIDNNKNLVSILNRKAKTYVESPFPLDMSKIISRHLFSKIQSYRINGVVKMNKALRQIEEKNCNLYEIIMDFPYPKEIKVWTTVDMPFDWRNIRKLQSIIWKLNNYSSEFIGMLDTIKGYGILSHESMWMDGTELKEICEVIEVVECHPQNDVYMIPEEYTKTETLSLQDFHEMGITIFIH